MHIIKVTDDQLHNNSYPKKKLFYSWESQQKADYNRLIPSFSRIFTQALPK